MNIAIAFSISIVCLSLPEDEIAIRRKANLFLHSLKDVNGFKWRELGKLGDIRTFGPGFKAELVEMTKSPDQLIQVRAAWVLWKLDRDAEEVLRILITGVETGRGSARRTAISAIADMGAAGSAALKPLVFQLHSFDEIEVDFANRALWRSKERAIPALLEGINSGNQRIKVLAEELLERIIADLADMP